MQEVLSAGSSVAGRHDSRSDPGTDTGGELGDAYPLGGDEADLEPVVRDAVLLALPLSHSVSRTAQVLIPTASRLWG